MSFFHAQFSIIYIADATKMGFTLMDFNKCYCNPDTYWLAASHTLTTIDTWKLCVDINHVSRVAFIHLSIPSPPLTHTHACSDKLLTWVEYHQVWRWESHESSPLTWFHVSHSLSSSSCIHITRGCVCVCACVSLLDQRSKSHFPRCPVCSFSVLCDVIVTLGDKGK